MAMNNLMILATAAFAMLLATGCTVVLRRKRHREAQGEGDLRGHQAWSELQCEFLALAEQNENGHADPADVKRAVARYHAALEDLPDGRESHQLGPGRKRVSHWF